MGGSTSGHLHVTVSIGIALFPDDGKTMDDLIKFADESMYEAKRKYCCAI